MKHPRRICVMTLDEANALVGRTVVCRDATNRRIEVDVTSASTSPSGLVAIHGTQVPPYKRARSFRVERITHLNPRKADA